MRRPVPMMPVYSAMYQTAQPGSGGTTRSPSTEPEQHADSANGDPYSPTPAQAFTVLWRQAPLAEAVNVRASSPAPPALEPETYTVLIEAPQVEAPHGIVWATEPRPTPRGVVAGRPN